MKSQNANRVSRWCVFTSAGDHHNVMAWDVSAPERSWDLIVAFYGNDDCVFEQIRDVSDAAFRLKGSKFQNLKSIVSGQPAIFSGYDFVFVADDDIHINGKQIRRLFEIAEAYDFWICHPAFSSEGRVSHPITQQTGLQLRITNFVEMTCPLFRSDKLAQFLQVYDGELVGWGIDWWYCNYFDANRNRKFAIIDEVTVINPHNHQRRGGAREIEKLQSDAIREAKWREAAKNLHLIEYKLRNLAYVAEAVSGPVNEDQNAVEFSAELSETSIGADAALLATILAERQWLDDELQRVRGERLEHRSELEYLRSERQRLGDELESALKEFSKLNAELQSTWNERQRHDEELRAAHEELETVRAALTAQEARAQALGDELRDVHHSLIWRATRPLRMLANLFRRKAKV